ncbi:MAG: GNAT family N-acetyltransferase [Phycisphaeraceae bacterium]|nr:GNAT family N-acetyltransferase [Phycisphaeraceae bacterium]
MSIDVRKIGAESWNDYPHTSGDFRVERILQCEVLDGGLGGIALRERTIDAPYTKRMFTIDDAPTGWARTFDLGNWGIFLAIVSDAPVGGAAVAPPTPSLVGVGQRIDAAVLVDIRVATKSRRRGVGSALLAHAAQWARDRGFRFLVIETQNVNLSACRFYAASGAELIEIRRFGYAHCQEVAGEAMLIWQLTL